MKHKYVRVADFGVILFPMQHNVFHSHVGDLVASHTCSRVLSAGFVDLYGGTVKCYGRSESIGIGGLPDDDMVIAMQLGLKVKDAS